MGWFDSYKCVPNTQLKEELKVTIAHGQHIDPQKGRMISLFFKIFV